MAGTRGVRNVVLVVSCLIILAVVSFIIVGRKDSLVYSKGKYSATNERIMEYEISNNAVPFTTLPPTTDMFFVTNKPSGSSIQIPTTGQHEKGMQETSRVNDSLHTYNGSVKINYALKLPEVIRGDAIGTLFTCPESIGANYKCQYYKPDWKNRTDIGAVLEERMSRVRKRCEIFHPYMFNVSLSKYGTPKRTNGKTGMMVNDRLKLGYCWMPKMGSAFWKRAWNSLNRAPSSVNRKRKGPLRDSTVAFFGKHQASWLHENNYTAYTISRNPWERLVSVYREKCAGRKRCKLNFGWKCGVTFEGFIRCVVGRFGEEKSEFYGHVETSYKKCGVCDFPYKYVVLMENMPKETEYLFKKAGVYDPSSVMNAVRNNTIRPVELENKSLSYTDFWKKIPQSLIDKVRFYYRYEILLFDYPETPFVIEPKS